MYSVIGSSDSLVVRPTDCHPEAFVFKSQGQLLNYISMGFVVRNVSELKYLDYLSTLCE